MAGCQGLLYFIVFFQLLSSTQSSYSGASKSSQEESRQEAHQGIWQFFKPIHWWTSQASSFAQTEESSNVTKETTEIYCQDIPISGCGEAWEKNRSSWAILRSMSSYDAETPMHAAGLTTKKGEKKNSPNNQYKTLLAACFGISLMVFGMLTGFFSPIALAGDGLIASCSTVMVRGVIQSYLSKTLAMSLALGTTGGLLIQAVAYQTGFDWQKIQLHQEIIENFNNVMELADRCNQIVFQGYYSKQSLDSLLTTTDDYADEAIEEWCKAMNGQGTEWHRLRQSLVKPSPTFGSPYRGARRGNP
jgi:hypothetical protein